MAIENAYQDAEGNWNPYTGSMENVRIPDGARVVGKESENTFTSDEVRTVWMPDSVEVVEAKAFEHCTKLESVRFSNNLKAIRGAAFMGCSNLRSVSLPKSLERMGNFAFSDTAVNEIFFAGTMEKFRRIEKPEGEQAWIDRTPVVHCTDGTMNRSCAAMSMADYLAKSFQRTNRKKFENYVVTGIWHRLRAKGILIQPVTQQYVKRPDGYALLDLYFPAINLSVECDEGYHCGHEAADAARTRDIIEAGKVDPLKAIVAVDEKSFFEHRVKWYSEKNGIRVLRPIEEVDAELDRVAADIAERYKKAGSPAWDQAPPAVRIREKGAISVSDRFFFRTHAEALSALEIRRPDGNPYRQYMRAALQVPGSDGNLDVCFMNMTVSGVQEGSWDNTLSLDGKTLVEKEPERGMPQHAETGWQRIAAQLESNPKNAARRIIFGRVKDSFGADGFTFIGTFQLADANLDEKPRRLIWKKVGNVLDVPIVYPNALRGLGRAKR